MYIKKNHCVWYNSNTIIFSNVSIHYHILIKGFWFLFSENWKHTSFATKRFCWMFTKCSTLEHTNNAIQHYYFFFFIQYNTCNILWYNIFLSPFRRWRPLFATGLVVWCLWRWCVWCRVSWSSVYTCETLRVRQRLQNRTALRRKGPAEHGNKHQGQKMSTADTRDVLRCSRIPVLNWSSRLECLCDDDILI